MFTLIAFGFIGLTLLNLLPTMALPVEIASAWTLLVGYMNAWDFLIPFSSLFSAFAFVVLADLLLAGWWVTKWVVQLVRGGS